MDSKHVFEPELPLAKAQSPPPERVVAMLRRPSCNAMSKGVEVPEQRLAPKPLLDTVLCSTSGRIEKGLIMVRGRELLEEGDEALGFLVRPRELAFILAGNPRRHL